MTSAIDTPYLLARYQGARPEAPEWFDRAVAQQPGEHRFESGGAQIELLTWGSPDKPGLLFLHGNGAHARWWSHIAPFFAGDWHCAALSWSGMGNSARREEGYEVDVLAQEVRDAAHWLGGTQRPVVIGHSMGGIVGLAAAAGTDLFRGVAVIDSPLAIAASQLQAIREDAPRARNEHRSFPTLAEGLARFRLSPPQPCDNDYIVDHIARNSLIEVDDGWQWHFDARRVAMNAERTASIVARVDSPIAFVYGEESALLTPETLGLSLGMLRPESPVIAIPDARHHVMLDQPVALVSALRALLEFWPRE